MKNYYRLLSYLLPFTFLYACNRPVRDHNTWAKYKGSDESINYSSLRQEDTANVKELQVAWVYSTGDADDINHSQINAIRSLLMAYCMVLPRK